MKPPFQNPMKYEKPRIVSVKSLLINVPLNIK